MEEIEGMSPSQRIATIATIVSLDDPDFKIDSWLKRERFFDGYDNEAVAYKKRKMGYKTPTQQDIAKKAASVGLPVNHIKKFINKEKEAQKEVVPQKKLILPPSTTPIRGVKRVQ